MPYHIEQEGNNFKVVVDATGKVVGTHPSKAQAQAQLGALYANVKDVKKCMTCGCDDLGNDHHYISDTQKCAYCVTKGQGPCWDGYAYAGTKEQDGKTVPNCVPVKKEGAGGGILGGGIGFKLEYNVPDCLGGYAITKVGTGQVVGCYTTKEHAQEAMEAIAVNQPVVKAVNPTPTPDSTSIWDGVFVPLGEAMSGTNYGSIEGDTGWRSTYNTPPQKDGTSTVGYGNSSGKKGKSNQ